MASNDASAAPVSILFVCTGNICRSTMAEGVLRDMTNFGTTRQNPQIKAIDSCGTGAYHTGDDPDPRTMQVLDEQGIRNYKHAARKIRSPQDFKDFDYVLAMDRSHLNALRSLARAAIQRGSLDESALDRIQLFAGMYGGQSAREEVPDPYYGEDDGFTEVYHQVTRCNKGLLKHIEESAGNKGNL